MTGAPFIGILFLVAIWFFFLRTRASRLESKDQFELMLAGGQPVVADFFSNT